MIKLYISLLFSILLIPIMVNSETVNVKSHSELLSAIEKVSAGNVIVLADGDYEGFIITKSGSSSSPILIKAQNIGGAVINKGVVNLNHVSHVILDGIKFTTGGASVSVDGTNRYAAISLINSNNCRITRCTLSLKSPHVSTYWVTLGGASNDNEIDHCEFGPHAATSRQIYIWPAGNPVISGVSNPNRNDWAHGKGKINPNIARGTHIHHNYFHDKHESSSEAIILGGLGVTGDYQDTKSLVEYNLFVNCDGDPEVISIKSSSNEIRYNTVRTSSGVFSSRAGNNNQIHGNFFLCNGKGCGVKIQEMNINVYNNYIENSGGYPIMSENGYPYNDAGFVHAQTVNSSITHNTIINPARQVLIGHGGGTLHAKDCVFANNILIGSGNLYSEGLKPENLVRSHNIISQHSGALSGFIIEDPKLKTIDGLHRLLEGSPAIDAADGKLDSWVKEDIFGRLRNNNDIGAEEFSDAPVKRKPLTASDVGPKSGGGVLL